MQNAMSVNVLEPSQSHHHPAFIIAVLQFQMLVVPQDSFQVCIQKFQHEIDVLLHGVHVEQLAHRISWAIPKRS